MKIKISNLSQDIPESIKSPFRIKGHYVLYTLKPNVSIQKLEHRFIKDYLPYANLDQDAKLQSETLSILQSPNKDKFNRS